MISTTFGRRGLSGCPAPLLEGVDWPHPDTPRHVTKTAHHACFTRSRPCHGKRVRSLLDHLYQGAEGVLRMEVEAVGGLLAVPP